MEEFKSIVFEKDDMEIQDASILKAVWPLLVNRDSKSDVLDKF